MRISEGQACQIALRGCDEDTTVLSSLIIIKVLNTMLSKVGGFQHMPTTCVVPGCRSMQKTLSKYTSIKIPFAEDMYHGHRILHSIV